MVTILKAARADNHRAQGGGFGPFVDVFTQVEHTMCCWLSARMQIPPETASQVPVQASVASTDM